MKRLITLIASAVLLCPMWAIAQISTSTSTTATVIPSQTFNLPASMPIAPAWAATSTTAAVVFGQVTSVSSFSVNFYQPNNNDTVFLMSGSASTNVGSVPLVGTTLSYGAGDSAGYRMQLNIGGSSFVCSFPQNSMEGACLSNIATSANIFYPAYMQ